MIGKDARVVQYNLCGNFVVCRAGKRRFELGEVGDYTVVAWS